MHIFVYSGPFFPKMGGLERNTRTLCCALTDLGHEVTLLTKTKGQTGRDYPFQVVRSRSVQTLFREISAGEFVLTNGDNVPLRVTPWSFIQGVPYGVIYHGFRGFGADSGGAMYQLKSRARRIFAKNAKLNVFTSTYSKEITDLPESTSHVLLNPVDKTLQELYNGAQDRDKANGPFLYAGRLIEGKGIFVLADALQSLDRETQLELVVAGEGRDEDRFREQIKGLETIDVTLTGRLGAAELVSLYQRSKALVVPTTTHHEGNPLVIAEALHAGTPVIASDQPPMVESVGDAGVIVEGGNVRALARAIHRLDAHDSRYASLRKKADNRAQTFSYERYRDKLRDILPFAHSTSERASS